MSSWSGRLGGVDDEDIQWSGGRFEFEAELLLDGGEDVWGGGVGRGGCGGIVGVGAEGVVEEAGEAGLVDDGAAGYVLSASTRFFMEKAEPGRSRGHECTDRWS